MPIINSNNYEVLVDEHIDKLKSLISNYQKIAVIVDENTISHCYPIVKDHFGNHELIEISSGEKNKNLDTCNFIWSQLIEKSFDRKSLVINLGGGVIGDMGGFCASSYMRGIDFLQMPTTLLSQVDASVGGKLGVDYQGLKNIVGTFNNPIAVWINTDFLLTLPKKELISGFAEMIKHSLISSKDIFYKLSKIDLNQKIDWTTLVHESVGIKNKVVLEDPFEKGLRKILNFGHSLGHAIETESLKTDDPLPHGYAIAIGMILESNIAVEKGLLSLEESNQISEFITKIYGRFDLSDYDMDAIISNLKHDKKNEDTKYLFSIVGPIGHCNYNVDVKLSEIENAFNSYR